MNASLFDWAEAPPEPRTPADLTKLEKTTRSQNAAANPWASAWVSANAGTGKTYVLVRRILRLLLAGDAPETLLCLTYTKAAAAQMANRLFDHLGRWATVSTDELNADLADILERAPTDEEISLSRTLFTKAVETPGGLKVQTIHAFCEKLLQRFPLEAGIAPNFSVLDEAGQRELLADVTDEVLNAALDDDGCQLAVDLRHVARFAGDTRFDEVVGAALPVLRHHSPRQSLSEAQWEDYDTRLRKGLNVPLGASRSDLEAELMRQFSHEHLDYLISGFSVSEAATDTKHAALFRQARNAVTPAEAIAALKAVFMTGKMTGTKILATKAVYKEHPGLEERLSEMQIAFMDRHAQLLGLEALETTLALLRITDAIARGYQQAKENRTALDYDDLILSTNTLLGGGATAEWVLYKLDSGLRHILIDEAQDTAPLQWQIISKLAEEFYAGEGASEAQRTLFAVGDEKQSIYRFQGAEPKMFAEMGSEFARRAREVGARWEQVPLVLSFRTVTPVLECVDRVFSNPARTPGITAASNPIRHEASRDADYGKVELWPTFTWEAADDVDPFDPLNETSKPAPMYRVADTIARQIRQWLDEKTPLGSTGAPIRPGDILILVRQRAPFAPAMIQALKTYGIPVAGADRIKVMEQLAVMDMMALGQFLILPEDDLSLACVLKSPLFGLDDDRIFGFACQPYAERGYRRPGTLWTALLRASERDPELAEVAAQLRKWRARADFTPPFEFFSSLLETDGRRNRFLSRLGPEAGDALDEFLRLAIQYDEGAPPSLQGFLEWGRESEPVIKRDMEQGRDEVRVMTAHGAKGLEASIVFLPDTCSVPDPKQKQIMVPLEQTQANVATHIWSTPRAKMQPRIESAREQSKSADMAEYYRLLYVAMTRARDQLIITGYEPKNGRNHTCWYSVVEDQLRPHMNEVTGELGFQVHRYERNTPKAGLAPAMASADLTAGHLPAWVAAAAPEEPVRCIPVVPSRLAPLESEALTTGADDVLMDAESGQDWREVAVEQPPFSPKELGVETRFRRGLVTHALLQYLPDFPAQGWEAAARAFIAKRAADLTPAAREQILGETLALLSKPEFTHLFGPESRAEVNLVAEIASPEVGGIPLRVTGQIDRLVVRPDEILIVDYKTNRPPPVLEDQVSPAYLLQLAAYRVAIRQVFGLEASKTPVRTFLLWTYGANIMEISGTRLDAMEPMLWKPDQVREPT